ncbi:hypothetical protein QEV83_07810 [Methylocapsa sp. D3K7]|uniref:hypothetical protein n=1 Tax=Methylocapsa sp. D3K7 TaxID=3041435 RepID=UPI00244E78EC|nr:hypothetical protein [Methylocapsa sp. D3K7]WGJ16137.1 hypothetical protein QEV83_07810 [Methylocapsa sp. D3K7]
MNLNISQFESRLPKSASDNARHNVRSAIMIANGFSEKAAEIRADGRLSAEGQAEKLAELKAATSTNGHLVQIRTQAQKQLNSIKSERDSFKREVLKRPEDPLAEMRAAEIRTMLRGLPETERLRLAMSDDAEIRDAVALATPVLSGVPAVVHEQIVDKIVSARFQTRSAELAALEDESEAVLAAASVASDFIARG